MHGGSDGVDAGLDHGGDLLAGILVCCGLEPLKQLDLVEVEHIGHGVALHDGSSDDGGMSHEVVVAGGGEDGAGCVLVLFVDAIEHGLAARCTQGVAMEDGHAGACEFL